MKQPCVRRFHPRQWPHLMLAINALSLCVFAFPVKAVDTFEPLILQDGDPAGSHPGLTDFQSVNGRLDVNVDAVYDQNNPSGATMPINSALGAATDQTVFPRLAYHCSDVANPSHAVTSFGGPVLRVHAGDLVHINFTNALSTQRTNLHFHGLSVPPVKGGRSGLFGDFVGKPYVNSTAPGNTRTYQFRVPRNQVPGPYWYHAHVHEVAEMQVACGLSGALYVEGSVEEFTDSLKRRFAPLLRDKSMAGVTTQTLSQVQTGLPTYPHHLLVLKDFWTPGLVPISGPLEQSVNGKVTYSSANPDPTGTPYVIQYGASKQLWEICNQSADLYYILKFTGPNTGSLAFDVIGRDGISDSPDLSTIISESSLFIPPGGRATVVVPTDLLAGATVNILASAVSVHGSQTFQTGNGANQRTTPWNIITLSPAADQGTAAPWPLAQINNLLAATSSAELPAQRFIDRHPVDATYVFGELQYPNVNPSAPDLPPEPAGFVMYRLADARHTYIKGPSDVYETYEPPIARLTPGHAQRWIIQNTTPEWHAFHLHQVHFRVERFTTITDPVDPLMNQAAPLNNYRHPFFAQNSPPPAGKTVGEPYYAGEVDTVSIPPGVQVWLTLPLNEGTQIEGEFVMHCHVLLHEDGGMMANVVAGNVPPATDLAKLTPHLSPLEIADVKLSKPANLKDPAGRNWTSEVFQKNDLSLVTFGYTTCEGACPMTVEKCAGAIDKLDPSEKQRVSPFFVSLDVERDNAEKLGEYTTEHRLAADWRVLLDTNLATSRAFGAQRLVTKKPDGSVSIRHTTTIYLIDRAMHIRAAFEQEDSTDDISQRIQKELRGAGTPS